MMRQIPVASIIYTARSNFGAQELGRDINYIQGDGLSQWMIGCNVIYEGVCDLYEALVYWGGKHTNCRRLPLY